MLSFITRFNISGFVPMLLDCIVCTEMFQNGAKIVGMKTIKMLKKMEIVGIIMISNVLLRVMRGGSWDGDWSFCPSAFRI
jgi:hypothetical protein